MSKSRTDIVCPPRNERGCSHCDTTGRTHNERQRHVPWDCHQCNEERNPPLQEGKDKYLPNCNILLILTHFTGFANLLKPIHGSLSVTVKPPIPGDHSVPLENFHQTMTLPPSLCLCELYPIDDKKRCLCSINLNSLSLLL